MTDENTDPKGTKGSDNGNADDSKTVPYSRFHQVNDEKNELKSRVAELEKERKAAEDAKLAENQEFEQLATQRLQENEELKKAAGKATELEKALKQTVEARIEKVPEALKTAIPQHYTPVQLLEWLDTNESLFAKPPVPEFDAGGSAGGGPKSPSLTAEEKLVAARFGMSEEEYKKYK